MIVTTKPFGWTVADPSAHNVVYIVRRPDNSPYTCTCQADTVCPHIIAVVKHQAPRHPSLEPSEPGHTGSRAAIAVADGHLPVDEPLSGKSAGEQPVLVPVEGVPLDGSMGEGMVPTPIPSPPSSTHPEHATTPAQAPALALVAPRPALHPSSPTPASTRTLDALKLDDQPDLPSWLVEVQPHQWDAAEEAVEHYKAGAKVVFVDAPTGSGKTLIGEMVRRVLSRTGHASKALYVCSDRALQDQFLADYDYAKVLKGRANYPTQDGGGNVTCGDCTKNAGDDSCMWCHNPGRCPYLVAKMGAIRSPLAVLNTAYLLAEANSAAVFSDKAFTILDECDTLEQVLMGYVEFRVGDRTLKKLKLTAPKKGSHHPTIIKWITDELKPKVMRGVAELAGTRNLWGDVSHQRELNGMKRLLSDIETILTLGEDGDNWVRDNDAGPLVLKPIKVDLYGQGALWRHADRWLCMSATIISPDQMADSLGIPDEDWEVVRVPMTFPVENRPIYQIPVASMTFKEKETSEPAMAEGVLKVVEMHPGERVLVHAVSYHLAKTISDFLKMHSNRVVVTYTNAGEKESALRRYRETEGAVLVASSMDRGVDLKGDDCRVVIIAKIPYPSLKDPQVSKRMHMPGGEEWYSVQTVRTIVQMTGRGVRSKTDWAKTYILDAQFGMNVYKRNKMLFPKWWRDAVKFIPYHHLEQGRVQ